VAISYYYEYSEKRYNTFIIKKHMAKKIVVTHDLGLSDKGIERLKSLGDVIFYDSPLFLWMNG